MTEYLLGFCCVNFGLIFFGHSYQETGEGVGIALSFGARIEPPYTTHAMLDMYDIGPTERAKAEVR